MKKSKILEIWTPRKWEWSHGTVFYLPLKLENWENISLGKKKPDAFKVGDEVCYEDYTDDKGNTKQREVKENPFKPKNWNADNNVGAMIGMAFKLAFEHIYDKRNYEETKILAIKIFEDAMAVFDNYQKGKSESKLEDSTDKDSLPF